MHLSILLTILLACNSERSAPLNSEDSFDPDSFLIAEVWINLQNPQEPVILQNGEKGLLTVELMEPSFASEMNPKHRCSITSEITNIELMSQSLPLKISGMLNESNNNCLEKDSNLSLDGQNIYIEINQLSSSQQNNLNRFYTDQMQDWSEVEPYSISAFVDIVGEVATETDRERNWGILYEVEENGTLKEFDGQLIPMSFNQGPPQGALRILGISSFSMEYFPRSSGKK